MTAQYYEAIQLIERLHRYFLDVVKVELDRRGIQDINNVQAMILHNIGTDEMTVGELTIRGYYLGSNVSYNVKKMVENDYLMQERSIHDKRSIRIKLSEKGKKLDAILTEMFKKHEEKIRGSELTDDRLGQTNQTLRMLERFWASHTNYGTLGGGFEDFE